MAVSSRLPRGRNFAAIVYPDCVEHMAAFEWITSMYRSVWIVHKPEEDGKKEHIHLMWHTPESTTAVQQQKFFKVWLDYVELVSSVSSYVIYMLHSTPECIAEGKTRYSYDDLQGDEKYKSMAKSYKQKSHFVQLDEIMTGVTYMGQTVWEVLKSSRSDSLMNYVSENQSLVMSLSNQQIRANERRADLRRNYNSTMYEFRAEPLLRDISERDFCLDIDNLNIEKEKEKNAGSRN